MFGNISKLGLAILALAWSAGAQPSQGTAETPVVLEVDVENQVQYRSDIAEPARRGMDPNATTAGPARAFTDVLFIGDIVAVNGRRARGTWTSRQFLMNFSPAPAPGFAIGDVTRGTLADCKWEFLDENGRFVGAIIDSGYFPHAVTGGIGAFLGVKGQMSGGTHPNPRPVRVASMAEDPGHRRMLGGGTSRIVFHLYPLERPSVVEVLDSSFRPVTAANPARRGDYVIVRASGLGPVTPGNIPAGSRPFSSEPLEEVNSNVEATINGQASEVLNKVGWPGEKNIYRVDVRIPAGIEPGTAALVLSAAWIPAVAEFRFPVR
ncbi:MAG TPA: hypothetical protein VFL57_03405 [Bryobacteraceae bacterium]|nr:hypothetical protein [Bryobacteraceae bacterium]